MLVALTVKVEVVVLNPATCKFNMNVKVNV